MKGMKTGALPSFAVSWVNNLSAGVGRAGGGGGGKGGVSFRRQSGHIPFTWKPPLSPLPLPSRRREQSEAFAGDRE